MALTPAPTRADLLRLLRGAIFAAAVGIVVGAVLFALFTVVNAASLGRDLPAARANIAAAFASGSLGDVDWLRGDTQIGQHQFNDCLILQMAVDQRSSRAELTVSPSWPTFAPPEPACRDLRRLVGGEAPRPEIVFYHRYVHGHTMLVRYLLPILSVDAIRTLYKLAETGVIVLGAGLCLAALAAGRRTREALFWLVAFVAFGRCFGIEAFGQSLGHAPADLVALGFLLLLAASSLWRGLRRAAVVPLAALFGGLTMIFEFLTGGIPLGLAILIGGLPLALRESGEGEAVLRAIVAYCAAIAACAAAKLLLIVQVFGAGALGGIGRQLAVRMGAGGEAEEDQGVVHFAVKVLKGLDGLVSGMREFAFAILVMAVVAGCWGFLQLNRSPDPGWRVRARLIAASNLVLPLWLIAFWEHTIAHSWFMDRILAWTVASGFGLFALAVAARPAPRSAPLAP